MLLGSSEHNSYVEYYSPVSLLTFCLNCSAVLTFGTGVAFDLLAKMARAMSPKVSLLHPVLSWNNNHFLKFWKLTLKPHPHAHSIRLEKVASVFCPQLLTYRFVIVYTNINLLSESTEIPVYIYCFAKLELIEKFRNKKNSDFFQTIDYQIPFSSGRGGGTLERPPPEIGKIVEEIW